MPIQLPQNTQTEFVGGKNILASSHVQFKEVGATLDATKFPTGKVEVGQVVARNATSGKFEPFTAASGFDDFGILNIDYINDGVTDTIVGELIVRGTVYKQKLVGVTDEFKTLTPMIRYI